MFNARLTEQLTC